MSKIRKIDIDKLECPAGKNLVYLWDSSLPGFGVRCTSAGIKSFVVRYRVGGAQRIKTVGRVQFVDLTEAQRLAREKLFEAQSGADPFISTSRDVQTVRDLAQAFQEGRKGELKAKTLESYDSLWKHIVKALGPVAIVSLSEDSVRTLRKDLDGKGTTFNRCLSLVLSALKWQGALTDNHPFRRAKKYKEKTRQRILSKEENTNFYKALGDYKREKRPGWRYADLFILLLLTGLRRDEWRLGRWEWLDFGNAVFTLPDNKTGGRVVYLSALALDVLRAMWEADGKPKKGYIFPAPSGAKNIAMSWTWRTWDAMRNEIGLDGFRIHDMRHTAGSYAHSVGKLTQRQVADFLGHHRLETSSRYIHDAEKRESAEIASRAISDGWQKPEPSSRR